MFAPRVSRKNQKRVCTLADRHETSASPALLAPGVDSAEPRAARPKPRDLRPLLALRRYVLAYPAMLALAGAALVLSAVAMLSVPLAVRRMIDFGFGSGDGQFIDRYFAMLVLIGIVLAIASSTRFYCVNWLGERVAADLQADVFRHLTTLGPAFFDRTHSAELMSRLTADTTQIKGAAGSALSQALRNGIMLVGALVMMFITSPGLSLLVLVAIPGIVLPLMAYGQVVRRLSRKAQDDLASASAYAAENLAAIRTMQAFSQEPVVSKRFSEAVAHAFAAARQRLLARAGLTALAIALVVTSIVGVLWLGSAAVVGGTMTGGHLSQFVIYAIFAGGAMAELSEVWSEMSQAAGSAERLTELLATEPEISTPERPIALPRPAVGVIVFDGVSFAYPSRPERLALANVSFRIAAGETVALVGPSGAGKSTIFNLLLRFYDPTHGTIRLDGGDISQADLGDARARIAYMPQEIALFADTVLENIRYGDPTAIHAAVERAAMAAQAHDFIMRLPEGYETKLGERGVTLSGGQRQRLALARTLLKNAPILLLDEATNALDAENEVLVQNTLKGVMRGRTTLVIAHRLATVLAADRILVLDEGRLVEEGTHADLMRRGGLYGRFVELQLTGEAAE